MKDRILFAALIGWAMGMGTIALAYATYPGKWVPLAIAACLFGLMSGGVTLRMLIRGWRP